jgi:hypothetical protein
MSFEDMLKNLKRLDQDHIKINIIHIKNNKNY